MLPTSTPTTSRTSRRRQPKVLGRPVPEQAVARARGDPAGVGRGPHRRRATRRSRRPFYGYDFTDAAHPLIAAPAGDGGGAEDRAGQEHLPRAAAARRAPTRRYDYGTHFLFQGHEAGAPGLHHADQPRRRPRPPRHADGDAGRPRRRPARLRRLDLGPVRPAAAVHRRVNGAGGGVWQATLDFPATRRGRPPRRPRLAAATRASRTTPPATSGSSRTSAARPSASATRSRTASSTGSCRTTGPT